MKRIRAIILAAVAVYAIALVTAWFVATAFAEKKAHHQLLDSRRNFAIFIEDTIDSILMYSSRVIIDELGGSPVGVTSAKARELAKQLHIDELNIAGADGVTFAANKDSEVGFHFDSTPETAKFLRLLDPSGPKTHYHVSYRESVSLTDVRHYYKYYGMAFPNRDGFVETGFTLERIVESFKCSPDLNLEYMRIGRYGHFEIVDLDGDHHIDQVDGYPGGLPEEGLMRIEADPDGNRVYSYVFPYVGLVFRAVLPAREFGDMRNMIVFVAAVSILVIMILLLYFLVKITRSSDKIEAMHLEAERRTRDDLSLARVIQMSSLSRTELFRLPQLDCRFDAVTYPAREVGGDFYNTFELSDGRIVFLVADVSGKGVPAAMFMHVATNVIQSCFRRYDQPTDAVIAINDYLCEHNEADMFVTAWIGVLDPKNGEVEYVNAGHNRPFVVRHSGAVERLDARGGIILGTFPKREYRSAVLRLEPGDRILLYTDGVTEAMNSDGLPYGEDRLKAVLASAPEDLCSAVKESVDAYVVHTDRSDDLTVLSLAWYGEPGKSVRTFVADDAGLVSAGEFLRESVGLADRRQKAKLLNATDEILANVVNYSGVGEYSVSVENIPGKCRVVVSDDGVEYNPLTHADPNVHVRLEDRPIGGLGILMAKKLVHSVSYRREDGKNILTLVQGDFGYSYRQGL